METWKYTPKIKNKTRTQHCHHYCLVLEILVRTARWEKDMKRIQIEKGEMKLPLFPDDMIMYVEKLNDFSKIYKNKLTK